MPRGKKTPGRTPRLHFDVLLPTWVPPPSWHFSVSSFRSNGVTSWLPSFWRFLAPRCSGSARSFCIRMFLTVGFSPVAGDNFFGAGYFSGGDCKAATLSSALQPSFCSPHVLFVSSARALSLPQNMTPWLRPLLYCGPRTSGVFLFPLSCSPACSFENAERQWSLCRWGIEVVDRSVALPSRSAVFVTGLAFFALRRKIMPSMSGSSSARPYITLIIVVRALVFFHFSNTRYRDAHSSFL